jgi:O-antigen/teichoic acid export membrane protein
MDMRELSVGSGVLRNLASQFFTRFFSNIGVRLLQVPILLHALGGEDYGRWLVLSTVPAWLTLANMGFGTVAGNEMLMSVASGDLGRGRTLYAASWKTALITSLMLLPPVLVGTLCLPVERWVGLGSDRAWEVRAGLCCLCLSVLLSLFTDVLSLRLRAGRRSDMAAYLLGLQLWIELLLIWWVIDRGAGYDLLGLANLASSLVCLVMTAWAGRGLLTELRLEWAAASRRDVFVLFRKGLHYQSLPVGHALILQGQLVAVNAWLGSTAVAIFGTTRTLVRLASQTTELVNHSVWPEFSRLFGLGELARAARLHRISVMASLGSVLLLMGVLVLFGSRIYGFWTDKILRIDTRLLLCFLPAVPLNACWYTSSMVHLSCNRYEGLSQRYLVAAGLSVLACYLLTRSFGLEGAAVSSLVADAIMIPFVWSVSLSLTGDRMEGMAGRLRNDFRWLAGMPLSYFRKG